MILKVISISKRFLSSIFILINAAAFTSVIAGNTKSITLVVDTQRIDLRADGYELILKKRLRRHHGKSCRGSAQWNPDISPAPSTGN